MYTTVSVHQSGCIGLASAAFQAEQLYQQLRLCLYWEPSSFDHGSIYTYAGFQNHIIMIMAV